MDKKSYESLQEIVEHENRDYPVGVYYVEPGEMFMEHVRWHWHTECELDVIKEGSYRIDIHIRASGWEGHDSDFVFYAE